MFDWMKIEFDSIEQKLKLIEQQGFFEGFQI